MPISHSVLRRIRRPRGRFLLMGLGMLTMWAALWAGLVRLGWGLPGGHAGLPGLHGPLMISGFLGTLIGLERAVALDRRWPYAAPLLTGMGSVLLVAGLGGVTGPLLLILGSLGLVIVFVVIVRLQPALHTVTIGLGALAWMMGNGLWLAGANLFPASQPERPTLPWPVGHGFELSGWPLYYVVPWWVGFLVLTIAGERLELGRLLRPSALARAAFLAAGGVLLMGMVLTLVRLDAGVRVAGLGLVGLALWLIRHDLARRTVHKEGLTRFIAVSLLSGFVWLGISGVLGLLFGGVISGPHYDAMLHTVFLGFVFAMIFGHAPIIFPAVLGGSFPFRSSFYAHLLVLQVSLLLRVVGDLGGWLTARQWGGVLNVVAILLFLVSTFRAVRQGRLEREC